jgi:EmrB/QacA subfamily drug resistance transporter
MAHKWWTLLAVCIATFMLLLDITIVNVALPAIQRDLDANLTDLQWVVDAYTLTLAALLLTGGSLADRLGRRRVFVIGVAIFTLGSILCGTATSPLFLNLARALQGTGGAAMFATALALIAQEFEPAEIGTATAAWGATIGAAVAIGPLLGGILTEGLGWQWIFFVNVPIGALAIAIALARTGESRNRDAGRPDWAGLVTFSGALFLLIFGVLRGNDEGWTSAPIVGALLGATLLGLLFVLIERLQTRAMLDLSLFRKPAFAGVSAATFAIGAGMFAMFLYLTIYLQSVLGLSPLQAGLRFLPLTVVSFFVAMVSGQLAIRFPPRFRLGTGLVLVSLGLLLMHGLDSGSRWTALLAGLLVAGAGIGLSNPAIAASAIGVVSPARSGMASGINNTFRMGGVATGIAALGALFEHRIESALSELLPHGQPGLADAVSSGGTRAAAQMAPSGARLQVVDAAREAFLTGLNEILLVGAATAFVGAICAFALIRARDFHRAEVRVEPALSR